MRMNPEPVEDFSMWAFLQRPQPADPKVLKELVEEWVQMATQKNAGQRGGKALSWDNLERVKMGILCESVALVMSGQIDKLMEE